jgi:hypothetical protein
MATSRHQDAVNQAITETIAQLWSGRNLAVFNVLLKESVLGETPS